jgi:hypothetical protein
VARAVRLHCIEALASGTVIPRTAESVETLGDEDILPADDEPVSLSDEDLLEVEGDTDSDTAPFSSTEEETGPTLSLGSRSEAAREVYRLFLASEYAPALALADELIAQGSDDSMLVSIARECRAAVRTRSSIPVISAPPDMMFHLVEGDVDPRAGNVFSRLDGQVTIEELARMTDMPFDDVLGLLERFVAMGVLTLRPPPAPR